LDLVSPSLAFSLYADLPTTIFDTFPTRRSSDLYVSAAQALLDVDGEEPNMQAQSSLDALLNQHLLQAWGEGRYQLHSIVTGYARDRKSTRLNSSHVKISYAVFCLKKKNITENI